MNPYDMVAYRGRFDHAASVLGWNMRVLQERHDREWCCSWNENIWFTADDRRVISERHLNPVLADEIIRIAALLEGKK